MEYPYEYIDCTLAKREKFDISAGHQPTHALIYMKEGSFDLNINGEHTVIKSGDLVIFNEQIEFSRYVTEPIVFIYIKFRKNERASVSMPLPYGKAELKDKMRFLSSMEKYESLLDRYDPLSTLYKKHLLEDILLQLCEESGGLSEPDTDTLISLCSDEITLNAVKYIDEHIREKLLTDDICKSIGTNPSTLNFKFRRELKTSVCEFIIQRRMKKARLLLSSTTYSVTDIAQRCGYENVFYFSRAFHKNEGIAPSAFRKNFT